MIDTVLDASALLALFFDEPGADAVREHLDGQCAVSAVNWAEVLTRLHARGIDPTMAVDRMKGVGLLDAITLVPFDMDQAVLAARLWVDTRRLGLSLGDRACLALAMRASAVALTADRAWTAVPGVRVRLCR
ncbi:MAG: type II toxin-antitoxin system VapC family toxin [Thermaerobacter sp.]|nr:type II toxin-antitoxin system VapC family toxin [Thermaerobacter sp.]